MPNPRETVFTRTGDLLYATATDSLFAISGTSVLDQSVGDGVDHPSYAFTSALSGLAATADGRYLFVGDREYSGTEDARTLVIHRIDTQTGATTTLTFSAGAGEGGIDHIAVTASGQVVFSTWFEGSGWTPLRTFSASDPAPTATTFPDLMEVRGQTYLATSPNQRFLLISEGDTSGGNLHLYDSQTGALSNWHAPFSLYNTGMADVSDNGLVVNRTGPSILVYNSQLEIVHDFSALELNANYGDGQFTRDGQNLLLWNLQSDQIEIYSTTTWLRLGQFAADLDTYIGIGLGGDIELLHDDQVLLLTDNAGMTHLVDLQLAAPVVLTGSAAGESIQGLAGADLIAGLGGDDLLFGNAGDDRLSGGAGHDVLDGGSDIDTADYADAVGGVTASLADGIVANDGDGGSDTMNDVENLTGSAFSDQLTGDGGDNVLTGGAGADILIGGAGADRLLGGDGVDTADYSDAAGAVTVDLAAGVASNDGDGSSDTLTGIEDLIGSAFADVLTGDGQANVLIGGAGNDILNGGLGVDTADYSGAAGGVTANLATGVASNDGDGGADSLTGIENLTGSAFADSLTGDDRANVLRGNAGNDVLNGGQGSDTATYSLAASGVTASLLAGTASNDGDGGADTLTGIENLTGSAFADGLTGDGLANVLAGRGGVDVLNGGGGFDTADYSNAAGAVTARLDNMRATNDGDGATDTFVGIEALTGSAFNDTLIGGTLGDTLKGGLGSDTLLGFGGDDVLWGGTGATNQLQGGLGDDTYVLEANDSVVETAGQGTDTVDARIATYILAANVETLIFGGTGNFTGTGNALNNTLTGGAGDDVLRGRGGVDVLVGGLGVDTADYSQATAGVQARLDVMRATNDGEGATDNFTSIEAIVGSAFNDTLVGGGLGDRLSGGLGADTILGFAGDDVLSGGQGLANQLQGGMGDDLYVLDTTDTIVELAGQGHDVIESHVGAYTMAANVEDMYYVGFNKFYGNGNAGNNVITGGIGNDILKGMGGNDTLIGGQGLDEVQFRGTKAQYTVTAEGTGYRVVDTVAGRDGSTLVESIETLRFLNGNTTTALTYPPAGPAPLEPEHKADSHALVSPLLPAGPDDAFLLARGAVDALVLPGLGDDHAAREIDGPQTLPGVDPAFGLSSIDLHHDAAGLGAGVISLWLEEKTYGGWDHFQG